MVLQHEESFKLKLTGEYKIFRDRVMQQYRGFYVRNKDKPDLQMSKLNGTILFNFEKMRIWYEIQGSKIMIKSFTKGND